MFRIVAIVLATLCLTYAAWANSATILFSKFAPERGLSLDSTSAQALLNITEKAGAKKDKATFLKIARANSIAALRSEPLSSRGLRQLGTYYTMVGNVPKGRQLIEMSAQLSHRDTPGQLWLISDYLRNGKSRDALQAIDIVIRTQPQTRDAAFGALGNALVDPEFRKVFVPYVRSKPSWLKPFIQFNVSMKQPQLLSQTLMQMQPLSQDIFDDRTAGELLSALVNRAPIEEARQFYLKMPGAHAKALTSIDFARPGDTFRFPPFGWELTNDGNVQGFGDIDNGRVGLEGLAVPGRSGTVARKLLFLRPGTYRWTGDADFAGMNGGGSAGVSLLCNAGPGKWNRSSAAELKAGRNQFIFTVDATCPAQLLTIDIAGADTQSDASMKIVDMQLAPTKGASAAATPAPAAAQAIPNN
jgi:hypothetical protein